jgi:hypothetical protein
VIGDGSNKEFDQVSELGMTIVALDRKQGKAERERGERERERESAQ